MLAACTQEEAPIYVASANIIMPEEVPILAEVGVLGLYGADEVEDARYFPIRTWADGEDVVASHANAIINNPYMAVLVNLVDSWQARDIVDKVLAVREDMYVITTVNHGQFDRLFAQDAILQAQQMITAAHDLGATAIGYLEYFNSHETVITHAENLGVDLIQITGSEEMQCGSSTQMFMEDALMPLMAEYGEAIVFVGFDLERLIWMQAGAVATGWSNVANAFGVNSMPTYVGIAQAQEELTQWGMAGRVAVQPVHMGGLLTHVALSYAQGVAQRQYVDISQVVDEYVRAFTGRTDVYGHVKEDGHRVLIAVDFIRF